MWRFYERALKTLRERKNDYMSALADGQAHSYDGYRFLCGKIQALSEMEKILKDLFDSFQAPNRKPEVKDNVELY